MSVMEEVRLLVQEEGRAARNLIAFHVPVDNSQPEPAQAGKVLVRKPPTSPRPPGDCKREEEVRLSKRTCDSPKPGSRVRSASTGRDKKSELQARYWAFLFGNLQRAVDEIYQTCETDESVSECKEVILVLENYTRDFHNLIEWFKVKWEYENTPPPQRPTSLAWEVRKSSPGKIRNAADVELSSPPNAVDMTALTDMPSMDSENIQAFKATSAVSPAYNFELAASNEIPGNKPCNGVSEIKTDCESIVVECGLEKAELGAEGNFLRACEPNSQPERKISELFFQVHRSEDVINEEELSNSVIEADTSVSDVMMVHQASQTDLEECVEDSDGLRFLSVSQPLPVDVPAFTPVSFPPTKPSISPSAIKVSSLNRGPVAPLRPIPRPVSGVRPQMIPRPAYAVVSRLSNPYRPQNLDVGAVKPQFVSGSVVPSKTPTMTGTPKPPMWCGKPQQFVVSKVGAGRSFPNPRLVRSRTATDVRSAGRGIPLHRSVESKPQRSLLTPRHVRTGRSVVLTKAEDIPESGLERQSGSNSSLNSSASSGTRSWADKVKGGTVSVEVLPRTGGGPEDDDTQGWETVKGRSRSRVSPASKIEGLGSKLSCSSGNIKRKSSVRTRFQQPSAATSLPALALHEVEVKLPAQASNIPKTVKKSTVETNSKSKQQETNTEVKSVPKNVAQILVEITIEPQKMVGASSSDGDKFQDGDTKEVSKEADEDELLLDTKLEDILEERNMFNEDELRKSKELCAEEEMLRKEIHELETADIEVDTETDETETDGEATVGVEEEEGEQNNEDAAVEDCLTLEARYENMLEGLSWAERMDTLETLQELVARHPGRALELHQKLSSPSRRRTLPETLRRFQAKQAQAKEKRDRLLSEKSQRLRELLKKVEEVKAAQTQLIEDKRVRLEMKLKRAEVNRKLHLKGIVRKAHDEEEKLKEIAFINELEAQNKRHDFMALCQEQEERLHGIQEERQRKLEEKAAKEAAAEERRRVLEAERQERLEKMQELRRKREERVGRKQLEREKERQELAREKARDREERLSALHAAQLATQEELQKKIQQKQEDSARRHEENIEHIRQRALESSIMRCSTDDAAPRLAPYDTQKLCQVCNVLIGSEVYLLSHLRGKKHQEAVQQQHGGNPSREELTSYNIRHIVDAPADKIDPKIALDKERQKALKKRCKKIRLRMANRGQEYETKKEQLQKVESPNRGRLQKCLRDVEKLHSGQGKGQWPNNAITGLERALGEINRILSKRSQLDLTAFQALNGFSIISNILSLAMEVPPNMAPYLPSKCFVTSCTTYSLACQEHTPNCKYVLFSNKVSTILDLLLHRLTVLIPDRSRMLSSSSLGGSSALPVDGVAGALMRLLAQVMAHAATPMDGPKEELWVRLQDVISYTVSVGVVDKLALYCGGVRDPIDGDPPAAHFLLNGLELLTTLAARCGGGGGRKGEDPTQLVATLQVTELVGAVSMLYCMLLHKGAPPRGTASPPPALPGHTVAVTAATIRLLNRVAELDLPMFQSVLGAEGISLQFRHIASYLLWYCSHDKEKELLHEVVRVVGFFAVLNPDNQMMLQSGYMPTVLQQLCSLPFPYFSNPSLSALLFPTLLACCCGNQQNRAILEQEVSYQLLEEFRASEAAKSNRLVLLLGGGGAT